jgi:hypothetical protein
MMGDGIGSVGRDVDRISAMGYSAQLKPRVSMALGLHYVGGEEVSALSCEQALRA